MNDFRIEINNVLGENNSYEGDADEMRRACPSGWHPFLEPWLADADATEMKITSASIGMIMTFRRRPGARG